MQHMNYLIVIVYFLGSSFGLLLSVYSSWFGDWEVLSEYLVGSIIYRNENLIHLLNSFILRLLCNP